MTLTCQWYESNLRTRLKDVNSGVKHSLSDVISDVVGMHWLCGDYTRMPVLRAYNQACSFWLGFDADGGLIIACSRSEFTRCRDNKKGILFLRDGK